MQQNKENNDIHSKFSEKLEKYKSKDKKTSDYSRINVKNYSIALNLIIELATGIGLGVFFGIMLDNYLQTKPLMLIIFFILGTIIGFYNMYKSLKKYGYFNK